MKVPTPLDLLQLPTALGVTLRRGDPIWFRQIVNGAGPSTVVPGFFDRYGSIRVGVVLVDQRGNHRRRYVSPLNVYARDQRVEEPTA